MSIFVASFIEYRDIGVMRNRCQQVKRQTTAKHNASTACCWWTHYIM